VEVEGGGCVGLDGSETFEFEESNGVDFEV